MQQQQLFNEITKLKIKRNKLMENVLTLEVKIAKLEMVIKHRLISHNAEMLVLLKHATDLEFKQLYEHKESRAKEIIKIINEFEGSYVDIKDIKQELKQYRNEHVSIFDKLNKNKDEISKLIILAIGNDKKINLVHSDKFKFS
jgi:hypothetical protein